MSTLGITNKLFLCVCICAYALLPLSSDAMNMDGKSAALVKTNLSEKYYQQALYYYFQGNYFAALNVISISQLRLKKQDQTAQLFQAGLQVKMGLQMQAKENLRLFSRRLQATNNELTNKQVFEKQTINSQQTENANELLALALLSLTEQFIAQGEVIQAQQTLAEITAITPRYYQQYHVLHQLAYWPEPIDLSRMLLPNNNKLTETHLAEVVYQSPYVQLNKALRFVQANDFSPAIKLLNALKNRAWQAPKQTFWQSLFTSDNEFSLKASTEAQIQNQAINDYARLLLAQLYAQQGEYEKVFIELQAFPQHSPYSESALFLFAFSAQKIKQHTTALSLLTLLHQQYPHSHLGWQASLLMAKQTTTQKGLVQGWQAYQKVETFFLNRLEALEKFEKAYAASTDLLMFSTPKIPLEKALENLVTKPLIDKQTLEASPYAPESVWLQQALYDVSLKSLYQQLSALELLENYNLSLQQKNAWITATIKLNSQRKARIAALKQTLDQQGLYQELLAKRASLSSVLAAALAEPQQKGAVFANQTEQVWLERIQRSEETLAYLVKHSEQNQQQNIAEYQQRLTRLNGVLTWQLKQQYPQRAWQHKQQLAELEHSLTALKARQNKVAHLSNKALAGQSNEFLLQLMKRQRQEDEKINQLKQKINQLKINVSEVIRAKVSHYINEQRALLAQHLLTTRRAMANVLEQMSSNDKRIERQLNLDSPQVKEQTL